MPCRILLRIAGVLLASAVVIGSPTDIKNAAYLGEAFAQESPPKGELIKGDVKPYGQLHVFEIQRGVGDKIIDGYDAQRGDKIRLVDFGLTDLSCGFSRPKSAAWAPTRFNWSLIVAVSSQRSPTNSTSSAGTPRACTITRPGEVLGGPTLDTLLSSTSEAGR